MSFSLALRLSISTSAGTRCCGSGSISDHAPHVSADRESQGCAEKGSYLGVSEGYPHRLHHVLTACGERRPTYAETRAPNQELLKMGASVRQPRPSDRLPDVRRVIISSVFSWPKSQSSHTWDSGKRPSDCPQDCLLPKERERVFEREQTVAIGLGRRTGKAPIIPARRTVVFRVAAGDMVDSAAPESSPTEGPAHDPSSPAPSSCSDDSFSDLSPSSSPSTCASAAAAVPSSGRKRMRQFLVDLLDSQEVEGLVWCDRQAGVFRLPWKHAKKTNYDPDKDGKLLKLWAMNTGRYHEGDKPDPTGWKINFRCALNGLRETICEEMDAPIDDDFRIYRFQSPTSTSRFKRDFDFGGASAQG